MEPEILFLKQEDVIAAGVLDMPKVMEQVDKMAFVSYSVNPATTMNELLIEKHFSRKHGPNAYYGQKKK